MQEKQPRHLFISLGLRIFGITIIIPLSYSKCIVYHHLFTVNINYNKYFGEYKYYLLIGLMQKRPESSFKPEPKAGLSKKQGRFSGRYNNIS
jgi:hypothetical protein